ncbi:unnamed protein product [Lymnaea stagnalis]|uniref:Uncharacterized protein n=1 Tax=Lymnaea stagnalis TaxID=6523 RepID=A0AAV2H064_LYMST
MMSNPMQPSLSSQQGPNERITLCCSRTVMYRMGMLSLCICFVFCVISCSSPNWIRTTHFEDEDHENNLHLTDDEPFVGLWDENCKPNASRCTKGLLAAKILIGQYLIGYFVIFGIAIFENVRKVNPRIYHSRKVEICVLILGILGTLSMIVFIINYSTRLGWSMALASMSVVGLYVTCLFLICGNKKRPVATCGQPGTVLFTSMPNQNSTIVQSYGPGPQQVYQTHYMAQTQPLLPAQTLYPVSPPGAPPPYSFPPAYPASFTPNAFPNYNYNFQNVPQPLPQHNAPFYPQQNTQPNLQFQKFSQASAPPSEDAP